MEPTEQDPASGRRSERSTVTVLEHPSADAVSDTPGEPSRLTLRPAGGRRGAVDGGWWPRSTDPDELLALAAAAEPAVGPIVRIAVDTTTWAGTPRRIGVHPHVLRIDTFRTWDTGMVRLVGQDGRLVDLLLVAPDTDRSAADTALAAAADPVDRRPLGELLGRAPAEQDTTTA